MLHRLQDRGFDVLTSNHADAILSHDFAAELEELVAAFSGFTIAVSELIGGGGGESGQTQRLRHALTDLRWQKHKFHVQTIVDGIEREGISHEVDHVRFGRNGTLALEIEWNNKDPFFDRDLENFQRLHGLSAISVGVIVTRGKTLQDALLPRCASWLSENGLESEADLDRLGISARTASQRKAIEAQTVRGVPYAEAFANKFVADKFGQATTHWSKLETRVRRGVGNPCPLLLIGLPDTILTDVEPSVDDLFSRS